jgi:hypothetical protein
MLLLYYIAIPSVALRLLQYNNSYLFIILQLELNFATKVLRCLLDLLCLITVKYFLAFLKGLELAVREFELLKSKIFSNKILSYLV